MFGNKANIELPQDDNDYIISSVIQLHLQKFYRFGNHFLIGLSNYIGVMKLEPHYLKYLAETQDKDYILQDLMAKYGNDVWNFAFFLTRSSDAADDLSQDVFLAVYDRVYSFRGECTMKSWILTITRNKSLNYLKKQLIRKILPVKSFTRKGTVQSAEFQLFDRIETRRIWSIVMQLPRKFREVVILDAHYDLTAKEIAELLGISQGTVKSRLHRARTKITAILETDNEGE
jgi:RNA polymerase sigma-70 factor, ECF subfamily